MSSSVAHCPSFFSSRVFFSCLHQLLFLMSSYLFSCLHLLLFPSLSSFSPSFSLCFESAELLNELSDELLGEFLLVKISDELLDELLFSGELLSGGSASESASQTQAPQRAPRRATRRAPQRALRQARQRLGERLGERLNKRGSASESSSAALLSAVAPADGSLRWCEPPSAAAPVPVPVPPSGDCCLALIASVTADLICFLCNPSGRPYTVSSSSRTVRMVSVCRSPLETMARTRRSSSAGSSGSTRGCFVGGGPTSSPASAPLGADASEFSASGAAHSSLKRHSPPHPVGTLRASAAARLVGSSSIP